VRSTRLSVIVRRPLGNGSCSIAGYRPGQDTGSVAPRAGSTDLSARPTSGKNRSGNRIDRDDVEADVGQTVRPEAAEAEIVIDAAIARTTRLTDDRPAGSSCRRATPEHNAHEGEDRRYRRVSPLEALPFAGAQWKRSRNIKRTMSAKSMPADFGALRRFDGYRRKRFRRNQTLRLYSWLQIPGAAACRSARYERAPWAYENLRSGRHRREPGQACCCAKAPALGE
jgi:hypothetical protein